MDRVYIIDDWLERDLIYYVNKILIPHLPIYFNHGLNDCIIGVHMFDPHIVCRHTHGADKVLFINYIIDFLYYKLTKIFQFNFLIKRSYLNFYPANTCDSNYHTDGDLDSDFTVLFMPSETPSDGSGKFEYVDPMNKTIKHIDYLQNRLIIFKSNISHKGVSFNQSERITLTFKCEKIYENCTNN